MPGWAVLARDILAVSIPVAATLLTGLYGLRIRKREHEHERHASASAAVATAATVSTESWAAFVAEQARWAEHQERTIARLVERSNKQDDKITLMYDDMGDLRASVQQAEARARAAITFARDLVLWAARARTDPPSAGSPPEPPTLIAEDLSDILHRLRDAGA